MQYNFSDLDNVMRTWAEDSRTYSLSASDIKPTNIVIMTGPTEMLKITEEGFFVRGVKVEADENEAKAVYEGFKQMLVWSELNRR